MNQLTPHLEKQPQEYLGAKPNNALDVLKSSNHTLNYIKSKGTIDAVKALLTHLIFDVNDFFKVEQMSDKQIIQTVELIIGDMDLMYLKPDDFILCFNRAKKGMYGKLFNRLDGQIIFEWINAYSVERDNEIIELRIKESQQAKQDCKVLGNINTEKIMAEIEKKHPPKNTIIEPIYQPCSNESLMKEFDALFKEQDNGGIIAIRTVLYNGKHLDLQHYVETRINEKI